MNQSILLWKQRLRFVCFTFSLFVWFCCARFNKHAYYGITGELPIRLFGTKIDWSVQCDYVALYSCTYDDGLLRFVWPTSGTRAKTKVDKK